MKLINKILIISISFIAFSFAGFTQTNKKFIERNLTADGSIPVWLVNGPFEQNITGFGVPADKDAINELSAKPFQGKVEKSEMLKDSTAVWTMQSINENSFMDFNKILDWRYPGAVVEKEWQAKAGYAFAIIHSGKNQKINLLFGSNSNAKIILNGKVVYQYSNARNATKDQDTIKINLNAGDNNILVKTFNSQQNYSVAFFIPVKYEWGFYLRLTNDLGNKPERVSIKLPSENVRFQSRIESTFFFKKIKDELKQRFDLYLFSPYPDTSGMIKINTKGFEKVISLDNIRTGQNRFEIYLPAINTKTSIEAEIKISEKYFKQSYSLYPHKHYELHTMFLTHTDIGYTNIQPVVKEMHINTLDDVVDLCEKDKNFKWTIETVWQLEQYRLGRSKERFDKLINLIKVGRISVSPIYTNPFTGWVGKEEMLRSLDPAKFYKENYGINYNAAVYDDVPGESFFLPDVLSPFGVKFLANGFNEVYNNYSLQRNLPKTFVWEGSDSSWVVFYQNETYAEGKSYGLARDNYVIEHRLWSRLNKLKANNEDYSLILLNASFLDNGPIAKGQYDAALKWDEEYAYPKFVISNLDEFADVFVSKYKEELPVIRGDATSPWDIFGQGEAKLFKEYRWTQSNILSAEKLSSVNSALFNGQKSFSDKIEDVYKSMLHFSGHGSGMEYGYGSPEDNILAKDYRINYVHSSFLETKELLERGIYRLTKGEESFEGPGVMVFNPLSWQIKKEITVNFPKEKTYNYSVKDLSNNIVVPSKWSGHSLTFIADSLPSLGYKKFRFFQTGGEYKVSNNLAISSNEIENGFYKIEFDTTRGIITKIISKKNSKNIFEAPDNGGVDIPLLLKSLQNDSLYILNNGKSKIEIINKMPVSVELMIKRENNVFEETRYTLFNGIDRIDVSQEINLSLFSKASTLEEYGKLLSFNISLPKYKIELLGGFINPDTDVLPGISSDAFSIRRVVAVYNENESVYIALKDSRVIKLLQDKVTGNRNLFLNLINNFPDNWNRNEVNEGELEFSYAIRYDDTKFNYAEASRFGWSFNTDPVIRNTWLKSQPSNNSFLSIDNPNIILLTIRNRDDKYELHLLNVNRDKPESCTIESSLFENFNNPNSKEENQKKIDVTLKPNEVKTVFVQTIHN